MSETEYRSEEAQNNNNVRVDLKSESELPEPPYFYSPYPQRLVQVLRGDTPGEKRVIEMINKEWPASIEELEQASEELGDGYTGTFIRGVLRSHYMPEDQLNETENPHADEELVENATPDVDGDENDNWHKLFRIGIRAALEADLREEDAYEAFGSGYVEGMKLREELTEDTLRAIGVEKER